MLSNPMLMSCAETNRGQGLEGSGGWLQVGSRWAGGQVSEGLQFLLSLCGRKCQIAWVFLNTI